MLGLYLIGKLKFPSDQGNTDAMPVPCIVLGMISLAFTVYLIPGLWGAPCKAVSAFAPPINTQTSTSITTKLSLSIRTTSRAWQQLQLRASLLLLTSQDSDVSTAVRWSSRMDDPQVADKLNNDFILISLYVDDKQPLDKPIEVVENGRKRKLRTVGDKWSYLQRSKFGANAQPFYVILDNKGMPVAGSYSYDGNIGHYTDFLNTGLKNYKK